MIRFFVVLTSVSLLQSCATTNQPTLELGDVPVLYEKPIVNASVVTQTENRDTTKKISESSIVSNELSDNDLISAQPDSCNAISEEINTIDLGLGAVAIEEPANTAWPTLVERTGGFVYNLVGQSLLGVLQPVIQTKRALFNDDEKDRRLSLAVERGQTRRAYLIGYAHASGCDQEVVGPANVLTDIDENEADQG